MSDIVTVQLRFSADTSLGVYSDTLSFTEAEWAKRDQKAIDVQKQALADTWVLFRTQQIADEQLIRTVEGKQAKISEIDAKIAQLGDEKAAIAAAMS